MPVLGPKIQSFKNQDGNCFPVFLVIIKGIAVT